MPHKKILDYLKFINIYNKHDTFEEMLLTVIQYLCNKNIIVSQKEKTAESDGFLLLFKFNYIADFTLTSSTDFIENITVITHNFVFVVIIDYRITDTCTFCKLISADIRF